jgi:hypothetical protein
MWYGYYNICPLGIWLGFNRICGVNKDKKWYDQRK